MILVFAWLLFAVEAAVAIFFGFVLWNVWSRSPMQRMSLLHRACRLLTAMSAAPLHEDSINPDDEKVLLVTRRHWASLIGEFALIIALAGLVPVFLLTVRSSLTETDIAMHVIITLLVPLSFLTMWLVLSIVWTSYYLEMLVVTDRRIFYTQQSDLLHRAMQKWNVADIRSVRVGLTGLIESLFNYGSITIEMRHGAPVTIESLPDPDYVSAVILKQDDRYGVLKETARKQRELLHFISHEVKGHLGRSKAAFAAIVEGDYGPVSESLSSLATEALGDSQKGVETVMSILDDADLKSGTLKIESKPFDLGVTVARVVQEFVPIAARKQISLTSSVAQGCIVMGDEEKIERHVIRNLIDNALRYTPAGQVDVMLEHRNTEALLTVSDTGVGITASDMQKLFTRGGHGEHSRDVNPESTGYGLSIAKDIVDAHNGKIWVHSSGPGTGSRFSVELPLAASK